MGCNLKREMIFLFKVQNIKVNVHDVNDRQLFLIDDVTGEQKEVSFMSDRLTVSLIDEENERLFDYYGREIQIDPKIAKIIECTGRQRYSLCNTDQENFLVQLKDGHYAIAAVHYYCAHSGGHKQRLLSEYSSSVNLESGSDIGSVWLECRERFILNSFDKNIIKESCVGYFLTKINREPENYWLLNTIDGESFIYDVCYDRHIWKDVFSDSTLDELVAWGDGPFMCAKFSRDKRSMNCSVKIDGKTVKVMTDVNAIDKFLLLYGKDCFNNNHLPLFKTT